MHVRVGCAAQPIDRLLQDGFCFGGTRGGHQFVRVLRASGRNEKENHQTGENRREFNREFARFYPHNTAPPFILSTSPVTKVARSEAKNRIGPAISAAVPTRPNGIPEVANFAPALVASTGRDISVSTQPGATQFTRMPWRASSVARDLTKLITAPLLAA